MAEKSLPVIILGGYLGVGKTTLLNRLLREYHGLRLAVLVNDFGMVNVDAALVESSSGETIALTNGCICCGTADGAVWAVAAIAAGAKPVTNSAATRAAPSNRCQFDLYIRNLRMSL